MEIIRGKIVTPDKKATQVFIYGDVEVFKASQDKLGRLYVWVRKKRKYASIS